MSILFIMTSLKKLFHEYLSLFLISYNSLAIIIYSLLLFLNGRVKWWRLASPEVFLYVCLFCFEFETSGTCLQYFHEYFHEHFQ